MIETTEPDPQVVAWMRGYLRAGPGGRTPAAAVRAYRGTHDRPTDELTAAYHEAARGPLTVADIPAGQGPASLFIGPDSCGEPALWFKASDGSLEVVEYLLADEPPMSALLAHLAATLPTVTREELTRQ